MKKLSNKTDINKYQEVPSINLNLQTEAAQYLVQQGQAKERGVGEGNKNKYTFCLCQKLFLRPEKQANTISNKTQYNKLGLGFLKWFLWLKTLGTIREYIHEQNNY